MAGWVGVRASFGWFSHFLKLLTFVAFFVLHLLMLVFMFSDVIKT